MKIKLTGKWVFFALALGLLPLWIRVGLWSLLTPPPSVWKWLVGGPLVFFSTSVVGSVLAARWGPLRVLLNTKAKDESERNFLLECAGPVFLLTAAVAFGTVAIITPERISEKTVVVSQMASVAGALWFSALHSTQMNEILSTHFAPNP